MDPSAIPSLGTISTETPPPEPAISPEPSFLEDPGFLKNIPEQDRPIVQKYLSTIDAGINNKFNSIHEQYKPYKELGVDVPTIQEALQINNILRSDPVAFFNNLQETLKQLEAEGLLDMGIGNDGTEGTPPPVNDGGSDFNLDGLPPEILKKISDLETVVKTLSEGFEQNKKSAEEAQQMQQLDNMMKELHTKHGEFDDEYLLLQLQKGLTPDQAIEQWNKFTEGIVNSRPKKQPPVIFSGAGQTQSGQVDPSKLSGQDRIKYIAGMLEASRG